MRAPIEPGQPGWDPDHRDHRGPAVGGALRGAGLIVILIAFLVASQQFITADQDEPSASTPGDGVAADATVYAAEPLRPVLDELATGANIRFDASGDLEEAVTNGAKTDVFVGNTADAEALTEDSACTEPAAITIEPEPMSACLSTRSDTDAAAGAAFIKELTSLEGREALLRHGFEVPQG